MHTCKLYAKPLLIVALQCFSILLVVMVEPLFFIVCILSELLTTTTFTPTEGVSSCGIVVVSLPVNQETLFVFSHRVAQASGMPL